MESWSWDSGRLRCRFGVTEEDPLHVLPHPLHCSAPNLLSISVQLQLFLNWVCVFLTVLGVGPLITPNPTHSPATHICSPTTYLIIFCAHPDFLVWGSKSADGFSLNWHPFTKAFELLQVSPKSISLGWCLSVRQLALSICLQGCRLLALSAGVFVFL